MYGLLFKIGLPLFALLGLVGAVFFYGSTKYTQGYNTALYDAQIAKEQENIESQRGSNDVRKRIQGLNEAKLNAQLCSLGIVYQNTGC